MTWNDCPLCGKEMFHTVNFFQFITCTTQHYFVVLDNDNQIRKEIFRISNYKIYRMVWASFSPEKFQVLLNGEYLRFPASFDIYKIKKFLTDKRNLMLL